MGREFITIFTPTYNRADMLIQLYESLVRQTYKNFIWYVINDGSNDNTDEVMEKLIVNSEIGIRYEKQINSGKHVAHNRAVSNCETEMFFCVDSDDYLTDNAIELIKKTWDSISSEKKELISGIVASKGYKSGGIVGSDFPSGIECEALSTLYDIGKKGDAALIFRTEVIKKYPFPVFEGENFLREHIVYDIIDEKYKLHILNEIVYLCEYLDEGLSKNATSLEMKNPNGAALARLHDAQRARFLHKRFRNFAAYLLFSIVAHKFCVALKTLGIIKTVLLLPFTFFGYIRYKIKGLI